MKGKVFDVRRFSTHDGSGIRTTIFLKGCPLQCIWCQNPEGIPSEIRMMYLKKKCIHCGSCLKLAKKGGVYLENGEMRIDQSLSEEWNNMIKTCPTGALVKDAKVYDADELVEEVLKDEVFFRKGGGVTLSGGEPLLQSSFTQEVLRLLHIKGVHTAIETSLSVSTDIVESVMPYLDQIYVDMKIADEKKHRQYVGMSNVLIKKNLRLLLTSGIREKVIVRTPLIPRFTATEQNLKEIARFLSEIYPEVTYELLNYNPLAEAKYELIEKQYCFKENPKLYSRQQMEEFGKIIKQNGIKNLIMEI